MDINDVKSFLNGLKAEELEEIINHCKKLKIKMQTDKLLWGK